HVIDDYYEDAALAAIADGLDPQDRLASGATAVPETSEAPPPNSAALLNHRPTLEVTAPNLTSKNWMLQYCRAISEMNRHLRWIREDRMRPFSQYPSIACSQKLKTKNEDVEMEWRYVEEEFRINRRACLGSDSDWNEEEKEEENENTENLPEDSLMTIYGIEGTEKGTVSRLGRVIKSGVKMLDSLVPKIKVSRVAHLSRGLRLGERSRNDWWTTSRKVRKKVPARPVVGLLDVCTGQVHDEKKRKIDEAFGEPVVDGFKQIDSYRGFGGDEFDLIPGMWNFRS
ncbi:hypothetical protein PPACK8108_LOCUS26113, partial [Phakopsora pachyrhizi]